MANILTSRLFLFDDNMIKRAIYHFFNANKINSLYI